MEKYKRNFNKEIRKWDEGIPLGNGFIGSLVWGEAKNFRFSLDRPDIWDITPCKEISSSEFTYENMVRLVKEKNIEEIRRIFDAPYNKPIPSKLPVGAIIMEIPGKWSKGNLDTETAEMSVKFNEAGKYQTELNGFIHADKKVGLIKVRHKEESGFKWKLQYPEYGRVTGKKQKKSDSVYPESVKELYYPEPETGILNGGIHYFIQKINDGFSYGIFVAEKSGKDENERESLIVYTIGASTDGENWKEESCELVVKMLENGYEESFKAHKKWWSEFWSKSEIELPDKFIENNWYLANYLLASCSRRGGYPMALQGLWTADDGKLPPWKGDYHHDLNTELSYYHYLKAGHFHEGKCFLDFLWDLREKGKGFAEKFYNAEGSALPGVMTIDGQPLGGWGMYSLSPVMSIWLAQIFERHYRYTGDESFLKERAYPYMKETGIFIECLLKEKEGKLYLPVSSSPEIHDDEINSFLTPNSNFDLSLMRFLYVKLVRYAEKLENGEEKHWKEILEKLPELAVNEKNVLMLSPDESLTESHRHFSHLMAIHPLRLLKWNNSGDEEIIKASISNLEHLGKGEWVGYSFCLMAELYAVAKNGNGAEYQLKTFWDSFCSDNGFHLNGDFKNRGIVASHYRPFTLEANMCAADALQEMLFYSEDNEIELFPAIPDEWQNGRTAFKRLRGEAAIIVTAACEDGKIAEFEIEFTKDAKVFLCKNRYLEDVKLSDEAEIEGSGWLLTGKEGEKVRYYP